MASKSKSKMYTRKELEAHGYQSEKSVWVAIHGKVYDVTQWKEEHPGGREILIYYAGTDCTFEFEDYEHSSDARELMAPYYIGELEPEPGTEPKTLTVLSDFDKGHTAEETGFLMLYGLPLVAVIIAYIAVEYFLL